MLRHVARTSLCRVSRAATTFHGRVLDIERTSVPRQRASRYTQTFGNVFTDHMFLVDWDERAGWHTPRILPHGPMDLPPTCKGLQYSVQAFESVKAYRCNQSDCVRLFRPELHLHRLAYSAERMTLPSFNIRELLQCIKTLVRLDADWVPAEDKHALYVRMVLLSTDESLDVGPSRRARLFVVCSPVGPYFSRGRPALSLLAPRKRVRAPYGGFGSCMIGANFGPLIQPAQQAAKEGFDQVLWLHPKGNDYIMTDMGIMNIFVRFRGELATPPLHGLVHPGITRLSVLDLARHWKECRVLERDISMSELTEGLRSGEVTEVFATGTSVNVVPVGAISYANETYRIPLNLDDHFSQAGPMAKRLHDALDGIQRGAADFRDWTVAV